MWKRGGWVKKRLGLPFTPAQLHDHPPRPMAPPSRIWRPTPNLSYLPCMLRRFACLFLFLCSLIRLPAQDRAPGIRFFEGSWSDLLATAQARQLPVFVDVYTDWCVPCRRMEKEVFLLSSIAAFYNQHYLSYRLNAEKGEGPALARQYGVSAYPTWLFLEPDGRIRSRQTDYQDSTAFLAMGHHALRQTAASEHLADLDSQFRQSQRDPAFLKQYLQQRLRFQLDNAGILDAYVATLATPVSTSDLHFLLTHSGRTWSSAMPLIAHQLPLLEPSQRTAFADRFFDGHLYFAWGDAIKNGDSVVAGQAMAAGESIYPYLSADKKITYDRTALYHFRGTPLKEPLKKAAYRLAGGQMAIDPSSIRAQDQALFDKVMAPFRNGQQDSTAIPGFAAERQLAARQYSGQVASLLYESAMAVADLLATDIPAVKDALQWATRANQLVPNPGTAALASRLRLLLAGGKQ